MKYDVAVIGGGVIGAAIFKKLSEEGYTTCILDKSRFSTGATGAAGGLIRTWHKQGELTRLSAKSYWKIRESMSGSFSQGGFAQTGALYIDQYELLKSQTPMLCELNDQYGLGLQLLNPNELKNMAASYYRPHVDCGAIYEPFSGYIDPQLMSRKWIQNSEGTNSVPMEMVELLSLSEDGDSGWYLETNISRIQAKMVCFALGAWTPAYFEAQKLEAQLKTKGILVYQILRKNSCDHPIIVDEFSGIFGRPDTDKISYFGCDVPDWGAEPESPHKVRITEQFTSLANEYLPWYGESRIIGARYGVDSYTETGVGMVSTINEKSSLISSSGWSGAGIKMAPAIADLTVKYVDEYHKREITNE